MSTLLPITNTCTGSLQFRVNELFSSAGYIVNKTRSTLLYN